MRKPRGRGALAYGELIESLRTQDSVTADAKESV